MCVETCRPTRAVEADEVGERRGCKTFRDVGEAASRRRTADGVGGIHRGRRPATALGVPDGGLKLRRHAVGLGDARACAVPSPTS